MAPRVLLRQPQNAVPAVEAAPPAPSVQRAWQTTRPGSVTSQPATATSSVLSGHRRGTTDNSEGRPGDSAAAAAGPPAVDFDRLIEAIEERVMAEIERRGGRYTGLF